MSRETTTAYPDLTEGQRDQLRAAAKLFAKHLQKLGEEARALGKESEGAGFEHEAEMAKEELVSRLDAETPQLRPAERRALQSGLTFFVKNLRAAKGTVRGLGKDALAEAFEEEAMLVERELAPLFADQMAFKGV